MDVVWVSVALVMVLLVFAAAALAAASFWRGSFMRFAAEEVDVRPDIDALLARVPWVVLEVSIEDGQSMWCTFFL